MSGRVSFNDTVTTMAQRIEALRSRDPWHQIWAAEDLANVKDASVTSALTAALNGLSLEDGELPFARALIAALAERDNDDAIRAVVRALREALGDDTVPTAACASLAQMRARSALPALQQIFESAEGEDHADELSEAIAAIAGTDAVPFFQRALQLDSARAGAAANALGQLGDTSAIARLEELANGDDDRLVVMVLSFASTRRTQGDSRWRRSIASRTLGRGWPWRGRSERAGRSETRPSPPASRVGRRSPCSASAGRDPTAHRHGTLFGLPDLARTARVTVASGRDVTTTDAYPLLNGGMRVVSERVDWKIALRLGHRAKCVGWGLRPMSRDIRHGTRTRSRIAGQIQERREPEIKGFGRRAGSPSMARRLHDETPCFPHVRLLTSTVSRQRTSPTTAAAR